ncbi:hypothetical protein ES319_A01G211100v1 [Gossypium barbadense]|uniref:Calmodulin-binding family protein n=2 Tax=Gossypium TaxID=3633 RepID=A0A5J5X1P2_GOSBA|nr:hypothetical protein ES319_A01G211100v1 [Gossypium barbadense]TYH32145.1 hypothetical protein ES288_A01G228200v1 [Gossypium darwinii]
MGAKFSSPINSLHNLENQVQALFTKSISFKDVNVKTVMQSFSFNRLVSNPKGLEPNGCGTGSMQLEEPSSFDKKEILSHIKENNTVFVKPESCNNISQRSNTEEKSGPGFAEHGGRRYQAALKLQKVYKSFRTRRQLADCAVVAEQRWWKLLDFAELKRSSISFFEIEKPETAVSRWSRARTRAAKVGKGLSQDEKARKLALQHWLEAIDPRHRYGHNLQFYYAQWLHCDSRQPFFYWLDIGDGREVNLEKCPRSKLQQQCIKYLGPAERDAFEVEIRDGKFYYKQSGEVLDATGGPTDAKWIFVLSAFKTLYVGMKNKGTFQHSSFLAGGATLAAGRLVVEDGVLKAIWPHSGHYLPTEENFQEFVSFLQEHEVDLTNVEQSPSEDEAISWKNSSILESNEPKDEGLQPMETTNNNENSIQGNTDSNDQDSKAVQNANKSTSRSSVWSKISKLKIPAKDDVFDIFKNETLPLSCRNERPKPTTEGGYETEEEYLSDEDFLFTKINLFGEDDDDNEEDKKPIPKDKIMRRIASHKEPKSYQLGHQLSTKWSTGAGPRISCMRDYPSELQSRVLQQAHLSPRSANALPRTLSRFVLTPTSLGTKTSSLRSPIAPLPTASGIKEKSKSVCSFETQL